MLEIAVIAVSAVGPARGDLRRAQACASLSLEDAGRTSCRKRAAWARKLLGDIARVEDRPSDAAREFNAALAVLERHACPTIEWQILRALLARARAVVQSLAEGIREAERRDVFLRSPAVRALQ
jgi:hypothetical protein